MGREGRGGEREETGGGEGWETKISRKAHVF